MSMATLLTDLHVHTLMTDDNLNYYLRSVCISNDFQDCWKGKKMKRKRTFNERMGSTGKKGIEIKMNIKGFKG